MFSETFKHTYNFQEKMAQVFQPRSINRALSRTHPELIFFRKLLESHFQGRDEVYFCVTDPIFSAQILIPDPKIAGEFDP